MTPRALALVSSLLACLACERAPERAPAAGGPGPAELADPAEPSPTSAPEREPGSEREPPAPSLAPVAVTPLPGADAPGPAYLAINTQGILRFDEDGVTRLGGVPERHVQDLFVGPDGQVYVLDAVSLRRIDGERLVEVERFTYADVAPVDSLALAPDGRVWVVGGRGVGVRTAQGWQLDSREALGLGVAAELVVGLDGTAWLFGRGKVLRRPAGADAWAAVELTGRAPLALHPSPSPSGAVLTSDGARLFRWTSAGSDPESIPLVDHASAGTRAYTTALALAGDGTLAVASGSCELLRFAADGRGEPVRVDRHATACATLEALAVDTRGRLWLASREGLAVVDGAERVEYPSGSFLELAGRVAEIVVVGQGPATLPPVAEPARVRLRGEVWAGEAPLADATIEACPTVRLVSEGSPCAGARTRLEAKTDAKGQFELDDVAIGDYGFAVEIAGQWRWTTPPSFAASLRAGETHELGVLRFDAP